MKQTIAFRFDRLVWSLVVPFVAGGVGSVFTFSEIPTWYAALTKPAWNPPNWLFGPVWTILYLLMGISLYRYWQRAPKVNVGAGISLMVGQLILNALWSIVFFGLHQPITAVYVIIALWLAIVWTMVEFSRVDKTAAWLLAPYLAWVTFASALNYAVALLN